MMRLEEKFNRLYEELEIDEAKYTPQQILDMFCKGNGFNQNGEGWIVLGDTFNIKEELKSIGGRWNSTIRHWIIPEDNSKYKLYKVSADDLFEKGSNGVWDYRYPKYNQTLVDFLKVADYNLKKESNKNILSRFQGNVGDKISFDVNEFKFLMERPSMDGGYYSIYQIIDIDGNYYRWSTSRKIKLALEDVKHVDGTVKEHREINAIETTVLKNCKVSSEATGTQQQMPIPEEPKPEETHQKQPMSNDDDDKPMEFNTDDIDDGDDWLLDI